MYQEVFRIFIRLSGYVRSNAIFATCWYHYLYDKYQKQLNSKICFQSRITCKINNTEIKTNADYLTLHLRFFPSRSSLSAVKTFLSYWVGCRPNLSFLFVAQLSTALCRYYIFKHPNVTTKTNVICYFIHYFSECLFFTYYVSAPLSPLLPAALIYPHYVADVFRQREQETDGVGGGNTSAYLFFFSSNGPRPPIVRAPKHVYRHDM